MKVIENLSVLRSTRFFDVLLLLTDDDVRHINIVIS